ncbi:histidine phosphatase family protein [Thiohalocapsa marina]|uniref:histidine phosphatase family protein n=1 Tax=Thiohalocapsa marina TaxID=424902 RepID=UPI0036DE3C1A
MSEQFIDLLRHGEVQGGACFRGDRDDPLTPAGWGQMRQATATDGSAWGRVISSPARRCSDFARHLADTAGLPFETRTAFRERGFGDWEGLTAAQIPAEALDAFWSDPVGYTPPGAEPFDAFRTRVLDGWRDLQQPQPSNWAPGRPYSSPPSPPHSLLVTHGGVIRMLVAEVLRMPPDAVLLLEVPHACLTRIRVPARPWRPSLVFHRTPSPAAPS